MMENLQKQISGDNSKQLQIGTANFTIGIDEQRARAIFYEMYDKVRDDFSQEALTCANDRVAKLEETLMPKIMKIDGALENFADPSFQFVLSEVHKTAAASEREVDYDLLSELLIRRIQNKSDRKVKLGISKAVEIVDDIDDDSLLGMTIAYAVANLYPTKPYIYQGLSILDEIYGKLLYDKMPNGKGWLEHLYLLNTIRVNEFNKLKKLDEMFLISMEGYACTGICRESENYIKAQELLKQYDLPSEILMNHELNEGYVRLGVVNKLIIDDVRIYKEENVNGEISFTPYDISEEQKQCLITIYEMYEKDEKLKSKIKNKFLSEAFNYTNLKFLREWWNNIPISFDLTIVGEVLSHANIRMHYDNIPDFEL